VANLTQIVDSLSASPTVLLDLNNESPFGAAELDVSPPRLRYQASSSMMRDGSRISQSSYENRELRLTFDVISTSQDNWAASFQTLARMIDQERFWVKYQPTGMTNPVFFWCFRASLDQVQDIAGATAYRTVSLTIMADPAAYGLPESGSVTVNNDPVAGTNPLFWRIGTGVKGDLAAPLFLTTTAASDLNGRTVLVSTTALRFGLSQTAPYIVQLPPASGATPAGFTTGTGDAAMSGGNYYRYTSTGIGAQTANVLWNSGVFVMAGNPIGDYKVMIRCRSTAPAVGWQLWMTQYDATSAIVVGDRSTVGGGNTAGWLDLGVFRFPMGSQTVDTAFGTTPASAGTRIKIDMSLDAGSVAGDKLDLDTLMFIPCGLDQAASHRTAFISSPTTLSGSHSLVIDGQNDSVYLKNGSGTLGTSGHSRWIGGPPEVVPNADNSLTWLRVVSGVGSATDDITSTTVLNWQYWPRYLYVRPATT
jgi:hypothetical protein